MKSEFIERLYYDYQDYVYKTRKGDLAEMEREYMQYLEEYIKDREVFQTLDSLTGNLVAGFEKQGFINGFKYAICLFEECKIF